MAEHGQGHGAHVVDVGRVAALHERVRLRGQDQILRGTRASAPRDEFAYIAFIALLAARARGTHQPHGILHHIRGHLYPAHQFLVSEQVVGLKYRRHVGRLTTRSALHDQRLFGGRRVAHAQVEHKPVELRLGQRVGALLLNGVLRSQHKEGIGQSVRSASYRHAALLHSLEQGALRLGGRTVDLVGE